MHNQTHIIEFVTQQGSSFSETTVAFWRRTPCKKRLPSELICDAYGFYCAASVSALAGLDSCSAAVAPVAVAQGQPLPVLRSNFAARSVVRGPARLLQWEADPASS